MTNAHADRRMVLGLLLCGTLAAARPARAVVPIPMANVPIPDGPVTAVAATSTTVYIGGSFGHIESYSGSGVIVNSATGNLVPPYPAVNGNIYTTIVDGAGGWYIGGAFSQVGGWSRNGLAHILPNGSLDTAWNPSPGPAGDPNLFVAALVLSGSTLYVGGGFSSIGGQTRYDLASLDAATGSATSWNPSPDDNVLSLALSGSVIYAGGHFKTIGGQAHAALAALDTTTGNATAWSPDVGGVSPIYLGTASVSGLLLDGATLYAGGYFTSAGGQSRNDLVALNTTTALASSWNPNPDYVVMTLALSGSTLYVGGEFANMAGQQRNALASFNLSSGNLTSWNPNIQFLSENTAQWVESILISGSLVYIGGRFDTAGGQTRNNLAALDPTTGIPTSWNPYVNNDVWALGLNGSNLYVGGVFFTAGPPLVRNHMAALDLATGNVLPWNPNANQSINVLTISGSTIYAGGGFTTIGGQTRSSLAALDMVNGIALPWNPNPQGPFDNVNAIAVAGSTIYVGGSFNSIGGQTRNSVAALDAVSGNATSWDAGLTMTGGFSPSVQALALGGSNLFVGGLFTGAQGQTRNSAAAFNTTTAAIEPWNPSPVSTDFGVTYPSVDALLVNGSLIYAAGNFSTIGGQNRVYVAALDQNLGNATAWNPQLAYIPNPPAINDGFAWALSLDGPILYAGGEFNQVQGTTGEYANLIALDTTTANAYSWTPNPNNPVWALSTNGPLLFVGGEFQGISGGDQGYFDELPVAGFPTPVVASSNTVAVTGSTFTYQINATNLPYSYGATALPSGFSVNAYNGLISGNPTTPGTSAITVSATNGAGTGTGTLTLAIYSACDINRDGWSNVLDVQLEVNMALGLTPCTGDINHDGFCSVLDVQRVVNAALGGACVAGP